MVVWKQHHSGVWVKSEHYRFATFLVSNIFESRNDFLVTDVDPIKSACCEDWFLYIFKRGNVSVDFQISGGVKGFLKPQVIKYNTSG